MNTNQNSNGSNTSNDMLAYFNLRHDGDTAVVRILHTSVDTIERANLHWISDNGKNKNVKCIGEGCPLCAVNVQTTPRIFIHLFDYGDNTEKVWSRTDTILKQLQAIQNDWGKLSDCVLRISRKGEQFPQYNVSTLNAQMYATVPAEWVDKKVAYRFYATRGAEELNEYLRTGVLPAKKSTYVPKEEYFKNRNNGNANSGNNGGAPQPFTPNGYAPVQQQPQQMAQPVQQFVTPNVGGNIAQPQRPQGSIQPALPQQPFVAPQSQQPIQPQPFVQPTPTVQPFNTNGQLNQPVGGAIFANSAQGNSGFVQPQQMAQPVQQTAGDPFMDGFVQRPARKV